MPEEGGGQRGRMQACSRDAREAGGIFPTGRQMSIPISGVKSAERSRSRKRVVWAGSSMFFTRSQGCRFDS